MICDKSKCTGCFACYNICPKKAINMVEDDNGFIYPEIDKDKCINCDLCKKVCPSLNLVDKKNSQFMDLFSGFDRFGAGFCVQFLRGLFTFLWSLLFVIPGIIASYRYAMAAYILTEHPEMTASEAIEASKQMMAGNKWRLFCMEFSFIGWDILCLFTFGIGFLVLSPYKEAAYAAFYREVSGTWERVREEIPNEPQEGFQNYDS